MPSGTTVGIDLGTSNTCVALCVSAKPEVILNQQGERTTPSVVGFAEDGKILVGSPAWRQAVMNPRRTITGVKRLVGRHYESPAIRDLERTLPYSLIASDLGDAWVQIDKTRISPQEIQAYVLERVRDDAQKYIGGSVTGAVVTVPAFFDEIQRQSVRDSGEIAGFEHCRILSEPTAAALAYGYAQYDNRRIVVADFGGGTLDITIMSVNGGQFEVLATDGDLLLGGHDFDRYLAVSFAAEIQRLHNIDVLTDPVAVQRLVSEAEAAKRTLSNETSAQISLPYLAEGKNGPVHYEKTLSRNEFELITQPLIDRISEPCRKVMKQAGLGTNQIDEVILVGGMTRTPLIQKKIGQLFERKPALRVNPDEVVAIGASLLGASNKRDDITFVDVTPRAIGLRVAGNQMSTLIGKSTPLPAKVTKGFSTTQDNQDYFELEVLQGEDASAAKNRQLASVRIQPIPRKRAGEVKLKVIFEIDLEGRLRVSAIELGSQKETQAIIQPLSGLTREQVEALRNRHREKRDSANPIMLAENATPASSGFSIQFGKSSLGEGTPRPQLTQQTQQAPIRSVPAPAPARAPAVHGHAAPPRKQPPPTPHQLGAGPGRTRAATSQGPAPAPASRVAARTSLVPDTVAMPQRKAAAPTPQRPVAKPSRRLGKTILLVAGLLTLLVAVTVTTVLYLQ